MQDVGSTFYATHMYEKSHHNSKSK